MATRRRFWWRALLKGASWTNTVGGAALNLAVVLAGVGLVVADYLPTSWLVVIGVVALLFMVGIGEGAYEVWEETEKRLAEARTRLDLREQRRRTLDWLGDRLNIANDIMRRWQFASFGEAQQLSEEFEEFDTETTEQMKERLPEFLPEYQSPPFSSERVSRSSWRDAAWDHIEFRVARLQEIREQYRNAPG